MARALQYHNIVLPRARKAFSFITTSFSFSFSSSGFIFKNQLPSPLSTTGTPFYRCGLRFRCFCTNGAVSIIDTEEPHPRPILMSKDLVALEYASLNLHDKLYEEVGHVRIRQHVNPLTAMHSVPVQVPDWNQVFRDTTLPLMVDLGSGKPRALTAFSFMGYWGSGRFLLWLAKKNADARNHLGLEIRPKLVKRANIWVKEVTLNNIHFICGNATVSFEQIASTYPGPLIFVSILCPDPHFKKKHHKRRVVQKPLVNSIIKHLAPGGQILIESDVHGAALDMRNQFEAESDALQHIDAIDPNMKCDVDGWLLRNPMGIRSEREIHAEFEGGKVYRRMYLKKIQ